MGHQHCRADPVVDRGEHAQHEKPQGEDERRRRRGEPEAGAAATEEEHGEQVAPADTVGQPPGGKEKRPKAMNAPVERPISST